MFHRTFPYFLWLLRDVTQAIPRDCKDLKDYFLKKVRQKCKNFASRNAVVVKWLEMCVNYRSDVLFPRAQFLKTWLSLTQGTPNFNSGQGFEVEGNVTGAYKITFTLYSEIQSVTF